MNEYCTSFFDVNQKRNRWMPPLLRDLTLNRGLNPKRTHRSVNCTTKKENSAYCTALHSLAGSLIQRVDGTLIDGILLMQIGKRT